MRIPRELGSLDIETIPDMNLVEKASGIKTGNVDELTKWLNTEGSVGSTILTENPFAKLVFHEIVEISLVLSSPDIGFDVISLSDVSDKPSEMLKELDKIFGWTPKQPIFTWNGYYFDFQVIRLQSLKYCVPLSNYWDTSNKYETYFSRYHDKHIDIADSLAGYNPVKSKLSTVAQSCGLSGKIGADGGDVFSMYKEGKLEDIRCYCEIDALLTYLLGIRFFRTRGASENSYFQAVSEVGEFLEGNLNKNKHYQQFLDEWDLTTWQ